MAKSVAIFQEKDLKTKKFIGNKIYYYKTKNPNWWFVSVGKQKLGIVPEYGSDSGQFTSRKQYPTISALEKYHKQDNIFRIK